MDIEKICRGCMKQTLINGKCTACGFDESTYAAMPHHLQPGTVLAGKYMFGKAIGEGGFGITYIGLDLNLNLRVAIKEYFPTGCVTRNTTVTDTVTIFSGDMSDAFNTGKEKFVEEARRLAKFNDSDGIVSVKDFFLENGTAYIVMEYLEGETLKEFLNRNSGKINAEDAVNMIEPILKSLSLLHKNGIIHRDISPDNIIITKSSKVKLIDFGAARDISIDGQRTLSVQLKPGYAPEEQYRSHGIQGSWTDVYAMCATLYRMITGQVPMESLERVHDDRLIPPSAFGASIPPHIEAAIMAGLAVDRKDRLQTIDALYNALYLGHLMNSAPTPAVSFTADAQYQQYSTAQQTTSEKSNNKIMIALLSILSVLPIVTIVIITLLVMKDGGQDAAVKPSPTIHAVIPTQTPIVSTPTPLPPRQDLYSPNYTYKRMDNIHNSTLVNDAVYTELKNTIIDFNRLCVEYMNHGNTDVFKYLPAGTTAYEQQTAFKARHSSIFEVLNMVDVINARYDGVSYYLWVTEDMTVTENGITENSVDYWVYRLQKSDSGYLIIDYTRDPARI